MTIRLFTYNKNAPELYEAEVKKIKNNMKIDDIHHVGSTAVPGLFGKNVIDILIGLDKYKKEVKEMTLKLEGLGYTTKFISGERKWAFLFRIVPEAESYQIHLVQKDDEEYMAWFLFRDYLRAHKDEQKIYTELKKSWLAESKADGEVYAGLKTNYVREVVKKAKKEYRVK
jgi:GrpB-like predicted nucleotidyltransferase (UPF0157 family)